MLPLFHATLAPQVTADAVLSKASAFIQNSIVKSSAPTSAGGPGAESAGSSIAILTRSMSPVPLPWKRSEEAARAVSAQKTAAAKRPSATASRNVDLSIDDRL